jgi:hypothetical protein
VRFLVAFERVLPLRKPSKLGTRELSRFILTESAGLTGSVVELLVSGAERAIKLGEEHIHLELLSEMVRSEPRAA